MSHIWKDNIDRIIKKSRLSGNRETTETKREAKESGSTMYRGTSCKRGHDGLRQTTNGMCMQCIAEKRCAEFAGIKTSDARASRETKLKLDDILEERRLKDELGY